MGVHVLEFPELAEGGAATAPAAEVETGRFAHWTPGLARAVLAALVLLLLASAVVPVAKSGSRSPWQGPVEGPVSTAANAGIPAKPYDEDIALYEEAIDRIAHGANYYDFIVPAQRARDYPVNPGLAVRLPTLAYLDAWLGTPGQIAAALALMLGIVAAWWRRFGEEGVAPRLRRVATAMVFVAASLGLNRHYFPLHELWAGGLIALSFGLHRIGSNGQDGRWAGAFCAAALALAIREHTLPFVLLMAATALWYRNWREAAAWSALVAVFFAAMAVHLSLIARDVLPSDPHSASWLVLRGLPGWLANVVQSSNLRWLPHFLAGPAVVLITFGWLGMKGPGGLFGFLLSAGYGVAFMLAGRWDNFYWGAMIAPAMFAGIVFAPRALSELAFAVRLPVRSPVAAVN
ncbi:hypothetical protein [Novosphingobium album (ex Hu et al. 2023)]|uniref:DUF2029 domain-containing protein n=1 Tax=Novosphingobium album (ex Hu et al. 2023) TaxID=2930093 RepID=A0ABT0B5P8_9SPHN|nr:hypothetical protein [Novosphingobium album (ex Hu et al. 2023)]MCJ2180397.1 hypothetical protein [Novosphingobium album (ex Hu et al. 2023)]